MSWFDRDEALRMLKVHTDLISIKKQELNALYHKLAEVNKEIELYESIAAEDQKRLDAINAEEKTNDG